MTPLLTSRRVDEYATYLRNLPSATLRRDLDEARRRLRWLRRDPRSSHKSILLYEDYERDFERVLRERNERV